MNISEAARGAGLTVDTVRYYDRLGLLGPLARTPTGTRVFDEGDVGWLRILRCLRDTGMPMAVLRRFCAVDADAEPGRRRAILEAHRTEVLERLERTRRELVVIEGKIDAYRAAELAGATVDDTVDDVAAVDRAGAG